MDNATHTLFALTLARTPLGRAGRGTTAALVIASNAPDLDIVGAARGGISYLAWHRGPTHGPLGIVGLGVATAGLVWIGRRVWNRRAATSHEKPDEKIRRAVCHARRHLDPRRAHPRPDGSADAIRHAAAQPVRLALVRRRLAADRRHLSPDGARRRALWTGDARAGAAEGDDRARSDGGELRPSRRHAPPGDRSRSAAVRADAARAVRRALPDDAVDRSVAAAIAA